MRTLHRWVLLIVVGVAGSAAGQGSDNPQLGDWVSGAAGAAAGAILGRVVPVVVARSCQVYPYSCTNTYGHDRAVVALFAVGGSVLGVAVRRLIVDGRAEPQRTAVPDEWIRLVFKDSAHGQPRTLTGFYAPVQPHESDDATGRSRGSADSIRIIDAETRAPITIARRDLSRIQLSRPRRSLAIPAAMAGVIMGAGYGVVQGHNEGSDSSSTFFATTSDQKAGGYAVLYGAIGGAVGGLVGRFITTDRWQNVSLESLQNLSLSPASGGVRIATRIGF